tara:strand:- start:1054 stop:1416 length:363 start_codon:yes stop_codon:yes gene_type:complete
MIIIFSLILFSAASFLYYGINSLFSNKMILEYKRWGFSNYRKIIAILQISASFGLIIGFYYKYILSIVSFSLFLMMSVAMITRIKVNDSIVKTLPSVFYALVNFLIFYLSLKNKFLLYID